MNDELILIKDKCFIISANNSDIKNKIIISLTSYPPRIKYVKRVLKSLINQPVDNNLYHICLVLCTDEFKNKEKDLPEDLIYYIIDNHDMIEIIWIKDNIRSHKKLIPTLQKYPDNYILICDDDIIRPNNWLSTFIKDNKQYPDNILVGASMQYLNKKLECKYHKMYKGHLESNESDLILTSERPANGYGGVLYPPNTFTNENFFDKDLYMELCPSSDEMWQYCFNIMENKTLRMISEFINFEKYIIRESQYKSLYKENIPKYNSIYKKLFDYFPKFKEEMLKRIEKHGK